MHFSHIAFLYQLTFLEDVSNVPGYYGLISSKQAAHLRLCQPDSFLFELDIQRHGAITALVKHAPFTPTVVPVSRLDRKTPFGTLSPADLPSLCPSGNAQIGQVFVFMGVQDEVSESGAVV
jgi:hypothetical protein